MTALLFYSISSDLTEDEIIEIDKQVHKNENYLGGKKWMLKWSNK